MIDRELYARIRRLFYAEHWKVGTIVAELGVHHDTVERAIEADRFGRSAARPVRASMLDPHKAFIEQLLDKHPKLRATRVYDMVRARGYAGSVIQVRRYLAKVRPQAKAEAYLRLQTARVEDHMLTLGSRRHRSRSRTETYTAIDEVGAPLGTAGSGRLVSVTRSDCIAADVVDVGDGTYAAVLAHPGMARRTRVTLSIDGATVPLSPMVTCR